MSLFFGGGGKAKPQYTGLQVQSSTSALPIPICIGRNRLSPNIIWQGDFQAHKQKQGKGGGKSMTSYTYSASFDFGLCWGPLDADAVLRMWKDKSQASETETPTYVTNMKGAGWTFFRGTVPQDPWGYMTSNHPTEALGYPGIVHTAIPNYDMGQMNTPGQHNFELKGLLYDTGIGGSANGDADPALAVELFLTDPGFGAGFDMDVIANMFSTVDAPTTGDGTFQTYCQAMGFALSPYLTDQKEANEYLLSWTKLCNTAIAWNGYNLKFHPWGGEEVTSNGVTYIPDFPIRYVLDDDDFIYESGADPVKMSRTDPADTKNSFSIIIKNRANEYNDLPVAWLDQGLADQYGLREEDSYDAPAVTETSMAQVMVALIGQRAAYIRNGFKFTLPIKYCLLEPMDVLQIVDPELGTINILIQTIEETEDDTLEIEAEEYIESISTPTANAVQSVTNTPQNTLVDSGPVNPPIIFEPPSSLAGSDPQVWAAVSGGDGTTFDPNWGGAIVWISTDNVNFVQIGEVSGPARMGKLTAGLASYGGANPQAATLEVSLLMSGGELEDDASATDAAAGQNLCYVGGANKEFLSFEVPTLTGSYAYDLTPLWRKLYGSAADAHLTDDPFVFLDDNVFKYTLPADYIGQTLYFKFQSTNIFDTNPEDLSTVATYTYAPTGEGFGTGTDGLPSQTTGISGSAGVTFAKVTWTANSPNDNLTSYQVWRATGASQPFGSSTLLGTVTGAATEYTDTAVTGGQAYTYFVVPVNVVGSGPNSAGVNLTPTAATVVKPFRLYGGLEGKPTAGQVLFELEMTGDENFPAGLSGSYLTAGVAATGTVDLLIKVNNVTVGQGTFAAGSATGSYTWSGGYNAAAGDNLMFVAPATQDATLEDLVYTWVGTRD